MENNERILCAANYYDDGKTYVHNCKNIKTGFVVTGHRHHNCIFTFSQIVGFPYSDEGRKLQDKEVEGFLTNKNRFVDRYEAFEIANRENQILNINNCRGNRLFSEDLY